MQIGLWAVVPFSLMSRVAPGVSRHSVYRGQCLQYVYYFLEYVVMLGKCGTLSLYVLSFNMMQFICILHQLKYLFFAKHVADFLLIITIYRWNHTWMKNSNLTHVNGKGLGHFLTELAIVHISKVQSKFCNIDGVFCQACGGNQNVTYQKMKNCSA